MSIRLLSSAARTDSSFNLHDNWAVRATDRRPPGAARSLQWVAKGALRARRRSQHATVHPELSTQCRCGLVQVGVQIGRLQAHPRVSQRGGKYMPDYRGMRGVTRPANPATCRACWRPPGRPPPQVHYSRTHKLGAI